MPPIANKGKSKGRSDTRRSRSRNTTPSSVLSSGTAPIVPVVTPYLEVDTSKLIVPSSPTYGEVLDKLGNGAHALEPKQIEQLLESLKTLSALVEARSLSCDAAMRQLVTRRREVAEEQREQERLEREAEQRRARKEADGDDDRGRKAAKVKKRKDRSSTRGEEDRPLAHGAHGVIKQDGSEIKEEEDTDAPAVRRTPGPIDSSSPAKKVKGSPGSSSLSEIAQSPEPDPRLESHASPAKTDISMDSDMSEHQPKPAPPVMVAAYFPDPLAPDPITYHIRDTTPEMSIEERKEIYSVASFPTKDLGDEIAGVPPDRDFSNTKPANQVSANTFLTYIEPYLRPLTEEDVAFLRERGDRTTPFLAIPRGKRHYTEVWAEEDGSIAVSNGANDQSSHQPRGGIDDINDDTAQTDKVSTGPLQSRILSLLRFEHRPSPNENNMPNGHVENGANGVLDPDTSTMDLDLPSAEPENKPLPPAAAIPELSSIKTPALKLESNHAEERLRLELRHLGFLSDGDVPDYEGHHDDDISERLRLLQGELKKVMITNGARKARLLEMTKERLAFQEYNTIHEDLDSQVQQAYLKRTRTIGKHKKGGQHGKPRPGTASVVAGNGIGRQGRDIGDMARMLIDRRRRWAEAIGPVFEGMNQGIPPKDQTLWEPAVMESFEKAEIEDFENEAE
ncbi:putative transcriptional regulator [Phaeomoniella chlamydospora]|uniref:Putative transcriptional regulator n=1 Tax=Phaeomoniella chlamydospora TaxID=158046 RepID=A0A0G2H1V6_PHACM|nr:putative transcriptional regulator [Phaeomoniella chlamydospora]